MKVINASSWKQYQETNPAITTYFSGNYPGKFYYEWIDKQNNFALVSYDSKNDSIIACRDHFGQEPLYYYYKDNNFIFSSNLPDLIRVLDYHPTFNLDRIIIECFSVDQVLSPDYSDETFYHDIYRVEPGCYITINSVGKITKKNYWKLDPEQAPIYYKNDNDYLDHFSFLMERSVNHCITNSTAAEFSGGLDSSSIVATCDQVNSVPKLYSHIDFNCDTQFSDINQVNSVLQTLSNYSISYVNADNFNPIEVFEELSIIFAGAPCYMFLMLANPVHQAVKNDGYKTLLSGFGGDECVSSHARSNAFYPEILNKNQYKYAWYEMCKQYHNKNILSNIKILIRLLRFKNPLLYCFITKGYNLSSAIKSYAKLQMNSKHITEYPYYPTLRHFECAQLQGRLSRHLRMRVEYSAIAAKYYGFNYAYPLLNPKLVEFCFRLPVNIKRKDGKGRLLMRRYLSKYFSNIVSENINKRGDIMPLTRKKYFEQLHQGCFDVKFSNLPFKKEISNIAAPNLRELSKAISYMFYYYSENYNLNLL